VSRVRHAAVLLVILAVLAAAAVAVRRHLGLAAASAQTLYATAQVTQGAIEAEVSGSATLQPAESVTLSAPAPGKVASVPVRVGQQVQVGQVVAEVDDPQLVQSITQAQLKVHADQETLAAAAGTSVDQAENLNPLQGVTVVAPQAGTVAELDVQAGAPVTAGEVLAKIVDSRTVIMDVDLVPYDKALVAVGDGVRVRFDAFSGWVDGTLTQVSPNGVVASSGTAEVYPAEIVLTNPLLLRPGDQGQVEIHTPTGWIVLPDEFAITSFGQESVVRSPLAASVEAVNAAANAWVQQGAALFTLGGGSAAAAIAADQLALQQDEASLAALQQEQAGLTVTSPIAGVVSALDVAAGQQVAAGTQIASVYSPNQMTLTLPVSELQVTQVKTGQSVQISTPGLGSKTFSGTVTAVSTVGQSSGGLATFDVSVTVDGGGELLPGMTADAQIVTAQVGDALLVPVEAVLAQSGGDEVEVLRNGQVTTVPVQVGLVNSDEAQIVSGLSAGETVITGAAAGAMANAVSTALSAPPGGNAPAARSGPSGQGAPPGPQPARN
jgi:HlyD family secretion protein